jgi:hypothetical protein
MSLVSQKYSPTLSSTWVSLNQAIGLLDLHL